MKNSRLSWPEIGQVAFSSIGIMVTIVYVANLLLTSNGGKSIDLMDNIPYIFAGVCIGVCIGMARDMVTGWRSKKDEQA